MSNSLLRPGLAVCLSATLASVAHGADFYYVLVFGSQTPLPRARYSHTFATFVKATGQGPCTESYSLECHTISWLPASLDIRLLALVPERGRNLDLADTLHFAASTGQRVSMWGPYQIEQGFYERALRQIASLESGQICYKAIDTGYPNDCASNCIHAVSALVDGQRILVLSPGFGEPASYLVCQRFQPWIIDHNRTHLWVAQRLGLIN
jgi:hypothetical protein